jgi:hypothetical protein
LFCLHFCRYGQPEKAPEAQATQAAQVAQSAHVAPQAPQVLQAQQAPIARTLFAVRIFQMHVVCVVRKQRNSFVID